MSYFTILTVFTTLPLEIALLLTIYHYTFIFSKHFYVEEESRIYSKNGRPGERPGQGLEHKEVVPVISEDDPYVIDPNPDGPSRKDGERPDPGKPGENTGTIKGTGKDNGGDTTNVTVSYC